MGIVFAVSSLFLICSTITNQINDHINEIMGVETKSANKELIHAAYAAIERILNEYFRENLYQVPPQNHQWSIQLSELETLTGQFAYWSAMGHHMYHPEVWLIDGKSKKLTTYKEAIAYFATYGSKCR